MKIQTVVGRSESVTAAVQNGADEILFTPSFPKEQAEQAIIYCRLRSVLTVLDLTGEFDDTMLTSAADKLTFFINVGLNAVLFSDFGILSVAKNICPSLGLHYDAGAEHRDSVTYAKNQGCSRVVISSEITRDDLYSTCFSADIPLQIQAIGSICPAKKGYSCLLGGNNNSSHNNCKRHCRKMYGSGAKADAFPLLYKHSCLLSQIDTFKVNNISVLTVKPPNHAQAVALLTKLTFNAVCGHPPKANELELVANALQNGGYTDTFFTKLSDDLLAAPPFAPQSNSARKLIEMSASTYFASVERDCVPIRFRAQVHQGSRCKLAADDYMGNTVMALGAVPTPTETPILEAECNTQWHKISDTPFVCSEARTEVIGNITITIAQMAEMRNEVIKKLTVERTKRLVREINMYRPSIKPFPRKEHPVLTIRVNALAQVTADMMDVRPKILYFPLEELQDGQKKVLQVMEKGIIPAVALPRRVTESQIAVIQKRLEVAKALGVKDVLINHPMHKLLVNDFNVRADTFITNTHAAQFFNKNGFKSGCIPPTHSLLEIKSIASSFDTEVIGYGRIPIILTDSCIIKRNNLVCNCDGSNTLIDEYGRIMPIIREQKGSHHNLLLHEKKLWLVDDLVKFAKIGIWAIRLNFTTENSIECTSVIQSYTGQGKYTPNQKTKGFYF